MPYNPSVNDISGQILAQGLISGAGSISRAIEGLAEERDRRGKEASQLRGLMKTIDPDNSPDYDAMGLDDLRERASSVAASRQKNQDKILSHQAGQIDARQNFLGALSQQYPPPIDPRMLGPYLNNGAMSPHPPSPGPAMTPEGVLGVASKTGYDIDPRELRAYLPEAHSLVPGQRVNLGADTGRYGIANSASSIQIFDDQAKDAEPREIEIGGKKTGWAIFPDGKYRILHDQDKIDAAQFDTDGDGVLSEAEWAKAILAQRLGGNLVPGQKITDAGPAPKGPGLFEQFQKRKAK